MREPRECPFCGYRKASVIKKSTLIGYNGLDERVEKHSFYVRCNRCFARGGPAVGKVVHGLHFGRYKMPDWSTTDEKLRTQAIVNWNMRY